MGSVRGEGVVITGVGPISSIGIGKEKFWSALLEGRVGARRIDFDWLDERIKTRVGAPVDDFDPTAFGIEEREARLLDPAAQFAVAAARMALEDAGLVIDPVEGRKPVFRVRDIDSERAGVILGTGVGGLITVERSHRNWTQRGPLSGVSRYALPMLIPNAVPAQVAIKYGFKGECKAVATACAAGTMAIGDAWRLLRDGELDMVLTGGAERVLSDEDGYGLIGFDLLRTVSTRNDDPQSASRPFDADRDGFVMSEGAGIVLLERESHARARGAHIYARIDGYAATCDAHSMMQLEPSGDQMVRVMRRAMAAADAAPDEIGYVNAHGTSTRLNDPTESKALHQVMGSRVWDTLVSSTKAMTGHAIAASGALEVITTAMSLAGKVAHRCVNLQNPDPECDLNLPRENQPIGGLAALSNSFGFGGHNATLVLRAP